MPKIILLLLLSVGVCAQSVFAQSTNTQEMSSFDELVDVGGRRLHINCIGRNINGSLTVVLEAGLGDSSAVWNRVQPEAAKFTRVCAYDRAGLGTSESAPVPRTVEAVVEDLHALLTNAKISCPYVLVGHSLGGILTRLYASRYPEEVAGMVLVDSAHEDEPDRGLALLPLEIVKQLKPEEFVIRNPRESIDHCSIRALMNAANWRNNIPLVVLTQGQPYNSADYPTPLLAAKFYQLHLELQKDLVRRSSRGRQIIARKSGHSIHQDQPELVIQAIRQTSVKVKNKKSRNR